MLRQVLLSTLLLSAAACGGALAQSPGGKPVNGEVSLNAGFLPDPHSVSLMAGGTIEARDVDPGCRGVITDAPLVRLDYTAGSYSLFISATASADTTLVVSGPDGRWYCDDDGAGYPNPRLAFDTPQSGAYAIWVGTYSAGPTQPATLEISEIAPDGHVSSGARPDASLSPTFGEISLTEGFTPDPRTVDVTAGGPLSASALGTGCWGHIAEAPSYSVNYTAGDYWPLIFRVEADGDTTLTVSDPGGNWHCNDDGAGNLNPLLTFESPVSGRYDVWVGTYGTTEQPARLFITELTSDGTGDDWDWEDEPDSGARPDLGLTPNAGEAALSAGFTPDPHRIDVRAGGPVRASDGVRSACRGYITEAADYAVDYTAGSWPLIFSADSETDTTLVVHDPDGGWHCDDDGAGYPNPLIRFDAPTSGRYHVWVGTYGGTVDQPASLIVTELENN